MPLFSNSGKHLQHHRLRRQCQEVVVDTQDPLHPYIHPSPYAESPPSPIKSTKSRNPPVIPGRESSLVLSLRDSFDDPLFPGLVSELDTLDIIGSPATFYNDHLPRRRHAPPRPYMSSVDLGQTYTSTSGGTLDFPLPPTLYTGLCATRSLDVLPLIEQQQQEPTYVSIDPSPRRIYTPPKLDDYRAPLWSRENSRKRAVKGFRAKLRQFTFNFGRMSDTAPPIPPRSEARAARSPLQLQPPFQLQDQQRSRILPVDLPLPLSPTLEDTPSLSSGSSSQGSPNGNLHSPLPITQKPSRESFLWGHKRSKKSQDLSKDPYKIRDGAEKVPPSSGVYTPVTFPGPRPSPSLYDNPRTPSDTYTPSSGPSRSTSISSAASLSAFSAYPESRFSYVRGKTLEHLKRVTNTVASYTSPSPTASSTSLTPITPGTRDSYFSTYSWSTSSRQSSQGSQMSQASSQGPTTPTFNRPFASMPYPVSPATGTGLGFQKSPEGVLPEHFARPEGLAGSILFDDSGEIIGVVSPQSTPQAKGKRKPVPRVHDPLEEEMEGLDVEEHEHEQVHAL